MTARMAAINEPVRIIAENCPLPIELVIISPSHEPTANITKRIITNPGLLGPKALVAASAMQTFLLYLLKGVDLEFQVVAVLPFYKIRDALLGA
ncbi:hypothetical protein, partial [Desulfosporosinus fructosivorans]